MPNVGDKSISNILPLSLCHDEDLDSLMVRRLFDDNFYHSIISSSEFQRLKEVSFLGAIDYVCTQNRKTRYEHSIDVAKLALYVSIKRGYNKEIQDHVVTAALLHDIGHAPLSHSMESSFYSNFGIDHHIAGREIILGKANSEELNKKLRKKLNLETLINLIDLNSSEEFSDIFTSKINVDTIDGVHKSLLSTNQTLLIYNKYSLAKSALIENDASSVERMDLFWKTKDFVYKKIINSGVGALADYISKDYFSENIGKLSESHFYKKESSLISGSKPLFKDFSKRVSNLKEISASKQDYPKSKKVSFAITDRSYNINESSHTFISNKKKKMEFIDNRYVVEKNKNVKDIFFIEYETKSKQVEMWPWDSQTENLILKK
jgi:HD superfamily phosphohydrolase